MKIHILGICGTFMGGVAALATEAGHDVSGSDANVYPPMSTQLTKLGIVLHEGYSNTLPVDGVDCVLVGNAMSRGNPAVEALLESGISYESGPAWLARHVLKGRWVIAVAGTHGKTTTASMVAWILEHAGMQPGFLIGGLPVNFGISARLGRSPFFVVEADEYDTAFFDKRAKFVHYHPRTVILNNLEFDHADIYPDLGSIETQFHHLLRTVPGSGLVIVNADDANLPRVMERGCWSQREDFGIAGPAGWRATNVEADGSAFDVSFDTHPMGRVEWKLLGQHNVCNALAAIAASRHAGIPASEAIAALGRFEGVKRRLEVRGQVRGVTVYDDFAHHPTAIASTLAGLRNRVGSARVIAVLEPRSYTMKAGVHRQILAAALSDADSVYVYRPADLGWDVKAAMQVLGDKAKVFDSVDELLQKLLPILVNDDHVLIMSNGGFGGLHEQLLRALGNTRA